LKFLVNKKGETIPKELVTKLKRASNFNEGFMTGEYLLSALIDMKLHLLKDPNVDPKQFEQQAFKEFNVPKEIVMRHRIPQFGHVFSGEGYAAGYYSYLWSDVLSTDAFQAFKEAGGPFDTKVADRLFKTVLSVGNTVAPDKAFKNFRGRDPRVEALLENKGFIKRRKR
ncbi:MAG: M3 family peptidase, partial [Bdellovibrionales bacterium]|nr:M3 family metallopeptidase [Bdellovibrionales bacterium]NQZ18621.1 M3 family peptidase [Bdellovibrionales bacterium]